MLNLKGKLMIDNKNYDIEIEGDISSFKFDDQLFVRQDKTQDDGGGQISKSEKNIKDKPPAESQWTDKEDKILIENYPTKAIGELEELLPAGKLKIKRQAVHGANWSEEENELLKKHYPTMATKKIVEENLIPNRTDTAISRQAFLLGLKKDKKKKPASTEPEIPKPDEKPNITIVEKDTDWSFEEEVFLREKFFEIGIETIIKDNLLPSKTGEQIRAKAKLMGLLLR